LTDRALFAWLAILSGYSLEGGDKAREREWDNEETGPVDNHPFTR
jgi:hypothetical protein